jgi:hypothetical protein
VLVDRVVAPICLGPDLIPNEDRLPTPVVKLLQIRSRDLDVGDAAKRAEVVDGGNLAVPSLVRRLAVEGTRWGAVEDVDRCRHSLTPEVAGQPLRLEDASSHGDHALIPLLHNPILLRGVRGGELALDAALGAVAPELHGGEFLISDGA